MKDLILGLSLAGNLVLGYTLIKKTDAMKKLSEKVDYAGDKVEGKAKQVGGSISGDTTSKVEGNIDEAKGNVKKGINDLKEGLNN